MYICVYTQSPSTSLHSTRPSGKDLSKCVEENVIGENVYHIRYRRAGRPSLRKAKRFSSSSRTCFFWEKVPQWRTFYLLKDHNIWYVAFQRCSPNTIDTNPKVHAESFLPGNKRMRHCFSATNQSGLRGSFAKLFLVQAKNCNC